MFFLIKVKGLICKLKFFCVIDSVKLVSRYSLIIKEYDYIFLNLRKLFMNY